MDMLVHLVDEGLPDIERSLEMDVCAGFLRKCKLRHQLRRNSSSVFYPAHDNKGLEFPLVALVGSGRTPAEDEREEARLFYVGAMQRLVVGASGAGNFDGRLYVCCKTHANRFTKLLFAYSN